MSTQPQHVDWNAAEYEEVRPGIFGATIHTPQLTATLYRYDAGSSWEEHEHPQDQVTTVLEGTIDFTVAGRPVRLVVGETAALPGGTRHAASVPDAGACVTINVLSSRRGVPGA